MKVSFVREAAGIRAVPVLINRNDYTLKLFNGDVGITLPDPNWRCAAGLFPGAGGQSQEIPSVKAARTARLFSP